MRCGLVTKDTKIILRSESAKYFIFLQMSREMWEFDEDGELYYEKAFQGERNKTKREGKKKKERKKEKEGKRKEKNININIKNKKQKTKNKTKKKRSLKYKW